MEPVPYARRSCLYLGERMRLLTCGVFVILGSLAVTGGTVSLAQVKTEVPPAVAGAKLATVERIRIRGASLEGNLEGNAVEREALVASRKV